MPRTLNDNKAFYRRVFAIALPMMAQNAVSMFVAMLDNLMVGQLATPQIGGVAIINNNLLFIFNICIFGGTAGAGIFTTQFYGSGDNENIRNSFRFKLYMCTFLTLLGVGLFLFRGDQLIGLYLQADGNPQLAADTLLYAKKYLNVMLWGLLPFAVTNAYSGTLRVCGHPTIGLVASVSATVTNLVGNYVLIFGKLGCPALGVEGAAIATVLSRYVEMSILVVWTHANAKKLPYVQGLYSSPRIPAGLLKNIIIKGSPLLFNEFMWSFGMASLNQCYSIWGQDVNAAMGISSSLFNLCSIAFKSLGITVGIIIGQMLGADTPEKELRKSYNKMTLLCMGSGVLFATLTILASFFFPNFYQTADSVRAIARGLILISACEVMYQSYIYPVYFTLRAGGKTVITALFDCGSIWFIRLPLAFILSRFTGLHVFAIYGIVVNVGGIAQCTVGGLMIRSGTWIQKLTVK